MSEIALIGKKIGMTREFYKTGRLVPVTVIKMEKARVIQVIDEEKRGYKAVQLGFGKIKASKLTKAMKGFYAKKNTEAKKNSKSISFLACGVKITFVFVLLFERVKLKDGFLGNWGSYLPQYFINAILLGASQVVV